MRFLGADHELVLDDLVEGLPQQLWVDLDGGAEVGPDEMFELHWKALGTDSMATVSLRPHGIAADLSLFHMKNGLQVSVRARYHLEALVHLDDPVRVIWVDMDQDGRVTMGKDRWIALPRAHLEDLSLANAMFLARETDEPWYLGERVLRMESVTEEGVRLAWLEPTVERHEFLAERARRTAATYFEWFDAERAQFLDQFEIDVTRPRAAEKPVWYYTHEFADAMGPRPGQGQAAVRRVLRRCLSLVQTVGVGDLWRRARRRAPGALLSREDQRGAGPREDRRPAGSGGGTQGRGLRLHGRPGPRRVGVEPSDGLRGRAPARSGCARRIAAVSAALLAAIYSTLTRSRRNAAHFPFSTFV